MDEQDNSSIQQEGTSRRRFIGLTLLGSLAVTIGGVLTPIIAYLWPPAQATARSNLRVQVGAVDEFPVNSGKVVSVANRAVIVVNT